MNNPLETQEELDSLTEGEWGIVREGFFVARGSSHVVAMDSSHVVAMDSSHVEAMDSSHVVAMGSSHVVAMGSSHVVAMDSSHVEAMDSSHVEAMDSSHVEARGSSHVEARGSSHVEARGSSHVEAWGSQTSVLWKSRRAKVVGNNIFGNKILTAKQWLKSYNVRPLKSGVILYKKVNKDYSTQKNIIYTIGQEVVAPDWDSTFKEECGKGLHFCASPEYCDQFRSDGKYIACNVQVKDMASLPAFAEYPDKIRARACKVLYDCDSKGNQARP